MRPQLKDVAWEQVDDATLRLVYDLRDQLLVEDAEGMIERLLQLLRTGGRTVAELATALGVPEADVQEAVAVLDDHRLIEDGDRLGGLTAGERDRYHSNLLFFESFATVRRSREDFHHRLRRAHVLVLGTGGLNSNTLPHLCGLGVGRLTLLDRDRVEARNFARQYLYQWSDVGERKVDRAAAWVRAFDPTIEVDTIDGGVDGVEDVAAVVARVKPDVVMSGIDSPRGVDDWVNAACVGAGIPFVRGGLWVTQGVVWSVAPGRSACRACRFGPAGRGADDDATADAATALFATKPRANRGIGPVAGLLGALAAFEVLRYLTRFEQPVYAGRPLFVDFADGCATRQIDWDRNPQCSVCGHQPAAATEPLVAEPALLTADGR